MTNKLKTSQVRLIGGQWRGRSIRFPVVEGLRPTPDRVRETLFNWLRPHIHGAVCLDLFAGSGALGFEAASQGASQVLMVENHAAIVNSLKQQQQLFSADNIRIIQQDALDFLNQHQQPFDIVFLDPPFRNGWLEKLSSRLTCLTSSSLIYVEHEAELTDFSFANNWQSLRAKKAGDVCYQLFKVA